jgi:hypothetical protein
MEMIQLGMGSPNKRKSGRGVRGSFAMGSFIESGDAPAPETDEQKVEREKKEF